MSALRPRFRSLVAHGDVTRSMIVSYAIDV